MSKTKKEERFELTLEQFKEAVEEVATKVVKKVLEGVEEKKEWQYWKLSKEEREAKEKEHGFRVFESADGESQVVFTKTMDKETGKVNGFAVVPYYTSEEDEDEFEEQEPVIIADVKDLQRLAEFFHEVAVDMMK